MLACAVTHAQIITGTFTGDGNSTQSISGLGFQPGAILVIPSTGGNEGGDVQTWIHSSSMPSGEVKFTLGGNTVAETFKTDFISSLDADGFTVATKSNVNSTEYYFIAFNENDGSVDVGTFTGSTSNQNILTGYQPAMVWVWADDETTTDYMRFAIDGNSSATYRFSNGEAGWGERVFNGFSPIGFSVYGSSTGGAGIANGGTYHYLSFQGTIGTANPGFGQGPDKVTTAVEPGFIITRKSTVNGSNTYIKTAEMPDGESFIPRHEVAETNALLDFEVDGYTVGNTGQLRGSHYYFVSEKLSTLPVEFTKIDAKEIDGNTYVSWTTGAEINNDYFEVLASNDGINWEVVATVDGVVIPQR